MHDYPLTRPNIYPLPHILLLVVAIGFVFAIVPLFGLVSQQDTYGIETSQQAPRFELTDARGEPKSISDYKGRYIYLMFGFMRCEEVCHSQAAYLTSLADTLQGENVEFLYLAMDSKHDEPSLLREYFDRRGKNFTSLHAPNTAQMQSVANAFNAGYRIDGNPASAGYSIEHPARIFLIDPNGRLRLVYHGLALDLEKIAADYYWLNPTKLTNL